MANKETVRKSLLINLSSPSKMPGLTFALPAGEGCPTGGKLCNVKGSVCEGCYGRGGCYMFPDAKRVRAENLDFVRQGGDWAGELIRYLTTGKAQPEFRFHDTGDIQSVAYLTDIVRVAKACPNTRFWVPTKEYSIVRQYLAMHPEGFPSNLCIRVSAPMIGKPLSESAACGLPTSSVGCAGNGFECPVRDGKEGCDTHKCRACWDTSVANINYHVHGAKAASVAKRQGGGKVEFFTFVPADDRLCDGCKGSFIIAVERCDGEGSY
jgi:hypothetical protein